MNDFHYRYLQENYRSDAHLLLTHTNSLCYEIKTKNFYQDMYDIKEYFDLSDMPGKFMIIRIKKSLGSFMMKLLEYL